MRIIPLQELVRGLGGKDEAERILASFTVSRNPDVEDFLHNRIFSYEESNATRSYFAIDEELNLLGFYSIAIATYQITGKTPQDLKEQLRGVSNTNRKLIPGILIGQLARFDSTSKKILPGKRITVCRLKSFNIFVLIANFAPSVPKRKPSGTITPARPPTFRRYMMSTIKRSAVSLLRISIGKLLFTLASVLPPYGGFMPITSTLSLPVKSVTLVARESQWRILGASTSCKSKFVMESK